MKNIYTRIATVAMAVIAIGFNTSCNNKKFQVQGNITNAKDSTLYFENMSLNGPEVIDSVKLGEDGAFAFNEKATEAPEFYRLRIASQIINVAVDSTENITIKAEYPTMSQTYEVTGSYECSKIQELSQKQIALQGQINAIANSPVLGVEAVEDSVQKILNIYKNDIKANFIFKEPMKSYAYFALFQTFVLNNTEMLIFNPRMSEEDIKVYAAVATSWDTFYPKAQRGENLHNIALENMKNIRIVRNKRIQAENIDPSKINTSGIIDIALTDNKGVVRRLSDNKGKVVILDFHAFADKNSMQRIMKLRDLYNKYHNSGLEIYQVSVDSDEHFWKTQTAALPWICVRATDSDSNILLNYNVQNIPTFFLLDKSTVVSKRDIQISDIDKAISALL